MQKLLKANYLTVIIGTGAADEKMWKYYYQKRIRNWFKISRCYFKQYDEQSVKPIP